MIPTGEELVAPLRERVDRDRTWRVCLRRADTGAKVPRTFWAHVKVTAGRSLLEVLSDMYDRPFEVHRAERPREPGDPADPTWITGAGGRRLVKPRGD